MIDSPEAGNPINDYSRILQETVRFFFRRIRQNIGAILLILLICVGLAAANWYRQKPYFESELVVSYVNERFARKTFGEMIEKLNKLARSGSHVELAKQLNLQPDQVKDIISIEGKNRSGSALYEDITGDHQDIYIVVRSLDRNAYPALQEALNHYLSNTVYQTDVGKTQVAKMEQKLDYYRADRFQADSLIEAYMASIRNGSIHLDSAGHSGPVDLLNYKDQVEEKITAVQQRLELEKGPSVLQMHGFAPADNPSRDSPKMILGAAIFGLLLGICWAVLRPNKRGEHA
jgi:hypothetical protein